MVTSFLSLETISLQVNFGNDSLRVLLNMAAFGLCQANTPSIHAKAADKIIEVGEGDLISGWEVVLVVAKTWESWSQDVLRRFLELREFGELGP